MKKHVLVIGGGATGVGIARDLSLRNFNVTLVEKENLGGGTSGKSHGLLHSGARYAESDYNGAKECIEENEVLKDIAGNCIRDTGGLFLQLEGDDNDYYNRKLSACKDIGISVNEFTKTELLDKYPQLTENLVKGFEVPDAVIYPSRLTALNAESAVKNGAEIYTQTEVTNIKVENNEIISVSVTGDLETTMYPDYVVNAGGPWAGKIADLADINVGMAPSKGVMVAMDESNIKPVLNRCRDPDDGDIVIPHENQVVIGTTSVPVSDPDKYNKENEEVELCIDECSDMLPSINDLKIERTWWGVRPLYSPDEDGKNRRGISRGFHLIDHDNVTNMVSVVGGKLTTYRKMAEETTDYICEYYGIDKDCVTAEKELPYNKDDSKIDEIVNKYGGYNPTDHNISK